jgi:chloride channel protein, CIC family
MVPLVLTQRFRHLWQPRQASALAEACLIGLVAALSAVFLKVGSGSLGTLRVHATTNFLPAWFVLPTVGLVLGFTSGLLVERLAPEAAGSGIPQVKAALANVPIQLSWRVAGVKLLSAIIALGSGLTLGRQGPTVHVGAALAGALSRAVPTSPQHRRQMIAAGAGAGLAAAFNAPITGILFVIEELLQDLSGLTLGTAIIASFIGAVVSRVLGGQSLALNVTLTEQAHFFDLRELPFFLLLGVMSGLFASIFHHGLLQSLKVYKRMHISLSLRVGLAGFISGGLVAMLPANFRDNTGLRELFVTDDASAYFAAFAFVAQFVLTLVAFGSGAPGGLFAPSLILGSTLGYVVGACEFQLLGFGSPTTYALAGMGAFFSAVSKVPITAIVIVFEMTTDFNLVLPLMIGSVTSYLVAESVAPGSLYSKILSLNGINIQKDLPDQGLLIELTAEHVMQKRVETIAEHTTLDEIVKTFAQSHHRGFPIVDQGKLVGIITQADLAKIKQRQLSGDATVGEIMTPQPITVTASQTLSDVLYLLDRHQISRLPVIDGRKLIGIITRADIIRAEAKHLNCQLSQKGPRPEPSYVVYQTRSPSIGRGRLLVPLANPETAATLLQLAAAIARDRHYEIECVQIILVSRHSSPAETRVNTTKSRRLLRQAESLARKLQIPLHTEIRVAHDLAQAMIEIINERHIDLLLMGWKGNTSTPGRIFGDVVDTLIRQASCELVLVKLAYAKDTIPDTANPHCLIPVPPSFNHWLVPMAGGPNALLAIKLIPALVTLGTTPSIQLSQVFPLANTHPDLSILNQANRQLVRRRNFSSPVIAVPIKADSVAEGVINLVKRDRFDVVVLGASCEGLLQQAIKGNIPEAIASGVESTVILVRGALEG